MNSTFITKFYKILLLVTGLMILNTGVLHSQTRNESSHRKDSKSTAGDLRKGEEEEEEDSIRRWEFGLNFGAYFPHKYSANFYNGYSQNYSGVPLNVNNLWYVMSNKYWYTDIKHALGSADTVLINGFPMDMHYQVAFTGGLFARFNISKMHSIILEANYTHLKAEDVVTFEVDPKTYLTYKDIRLIPVVGREGRVLIDLGYQLSFPLDSKIILFLQAGGTMCYTQVLKSMIVVNNREYSMINIYGSQGYVPNTDLQTLNINQNAFGWGGFLGAGVGIPLTDLFGIEAGVNGQYYPVGIENFPEYRPSFSAYLRIMLYLGQKADE